MRQSLSMLTTLLLLFSQSAHAAWFKRSEGIMGTRINVEIWHQNKDHAERCMQQVMDEMQRINLSMSPFIESSELSQLNLHAAEKWMPVSQELFDLIRQSIKVSELSHGAFDITFASIGYRYDYRQHIRPDDKEIKAKLDFINFKHIRLDAQKRRIHFARQGVRIDLGGIAKGHAVDNSIEILKKCDIHNGLVSAGGDTRLLGDRRGREWITGIRHPRSNNEYETALKIPLSDIAISTSGDYERYFIEDGVRYHHIISPKTGKSAHGILSASVIGPRSTLTDALSTTVFVLGVKKGLELVEKLDGFDAIIIDAQGRLHYSEGLAPPQ